MIDLNFIPEVPEGGLIPLPGVRNTDQSYFRAAEGLGVKIGIYSERKSEYVIGCVLTQKTSCRLMLFLFGLSDWFRRNFPACIIDQAIFLTPTRYHHVLSQVQTQARIGFDDSNHTALFSINTHQTRIYRVCSSCRLCHKEAHKAEKNRKFIEGQAVISLLSTSLVAYQQVEPNSSTLYSSVIGLKISAIIMANSQDDESSSSDSSLTWRGMDVPHLYFDITDQVELSGLDILNYDSQLGNAKILFDQSSPSALSQSKEKAGKQPTVFDWVESDVDEQLMLFIPFQSAIGIQSIHLSSLPLSTLEDDTASIRPKQIKLYANQSHNLDFATADDIPETQMVELEEQNWNNKTGTAQLQLRFVNFQRIRSLVMFIVSGEGDSDKVRLDRVRIIGRSGAKKDPGRLRRVDEDWNEPRLPVPNLVEHSGSYNIEEQLRKMGATNLFDPTAEATDLRAVELAQTVTMQMDYAPGLDTNGLCRCCARVVKTWRGPDIVARIFNMEFSARRFTTPKMQHHRSVASLKDCGKNQQCTLCKMIYSEIIYSKKEKLNRSRLPNDGITTSFFGHFVDGSSDELRNWSAIKTSLDQLPKGELVFSTSSGDVDAIHDGEVQIPLGGVRLSLTSGNPGARESPNLQIAVGHANRCKLDIHPLEGMQKIRFVEINYSDHFRLTWQYSGRVLQHG